MFQPGPWKRAGMGVVACPYTRGRPTILRAEIFFENARCFRVASACAWRQKILLAEIHEPLQMVARRKGFEPLTPKFEVFRHQFRSVFSGSG